MNAKQILLRVFSGILALVCILSLVLTGHGFRQILDCKSYWEAEGKAAGEGFDKLESGQKTKMRYTYPDSRTAFRAAADALKEIIGGL